MKYDCEPYQECPNEKQCRAYGHCVVGHEARRLVSGGITFTKDGSLAGISIPASERIDAHSQFPRNEDQLELTARI